MFADDLVVIARSEEKLQRRWSHWQTEMEKNGLEVNIQKTEVMISSREVLRMDIRNRQGASVEQVEKLNIKVSLEGGSSIAVQARITASWAKWRELSCAIKE